MNSKILLLSLTYKVLVYKSLTCTFLQENCRKKRRLLEKFTVHAKTVIVSDLTGKSTMWGSESSDERGRLLEEFILSKGAVVINSGQPTYQRYSGT